MELLRNQIKHHFLNQIVFRLDYEGLLEKDVEECVFNLRQKFYGAGFTHMNRRAENQVDIQVKIDLNVSSDNEYMVSNTNEGWVYIFSSDSNEVIELSKNFFTLTIEGIRNIRHLINIFLCLRSQSNLLKTVRRTFVH